MDNLTLEQMSEKKAELELSSATLLGQMLFEYSRLDVNLGLCLVWSGEGSQIESLTNNVESLTFHKKLDLLKEKVGHAFVDGSNKRSAYSEWIDFAQVIRTKRNELVHGRWGVDPYRGEAVNIVGLPTSPDQKEVRYTIMDLQDFLNQIKSLQNRLSVLRNQWPV